MSLADNQDRFLTDLTGLVPLLRREADEIDAGTAYPQRSLAALRDLGALAAPLPPAHGGLDLGVTSEGAPAAEFLRLLGSGSIAIGRLVEGHLNALRLVARYGTDRQLARAAREAAGGHLFGIWVTETGAPLRLVRRGADRLLDGNKSFCSGAGLVTRPLLTATADDDQPPVMILARLDGSEAIGPTRAMSGVRGARTADMALSGLQVHDDDLVGSPGDYLRQPEFSAGAWRGSSVALGGLDALVETAISQLMARGRHANPHQAARIGRLIIAAETARHWVDRASRAGMLAADETVATVNLARIAVETVCLDALRDVQRALGLQAFVRDNPVERMMRDLATYLRQPAPDETLTEAAIFFSGRGLRPSPRP